MRFSTFLKESYVTSRGSVEIFKNPTPKEALTACQDQGYCRFLLDMGKKDIYVWDWKLMHHDANIYLKKDNIVNSEYPSYDDKWIWGEATHARGNKFYVDSISGNKEVKDIRWAEKWFINLDSWFRDYRG
jgi:hypothetical protein